MPASSELLARYRRCRETVTKLGHLAATTLTKEILQEGARDLGMMRKNNVILFNTEDETSVLMDYCIYNITRNGRNAVQDLLARLPLPEGSDEKTALEAMSKAWYSVFVITSVDKAGSLEVEDLLRQTDHVLLDLNLSRTAPVGGLLATRVIPFEDFIMSGGAGLPLAGDLSQRDTLIAGMTKVLHHHNIADFNQMSPQQDRALAKAIISKALAWGASEYVRYQSPDALNDRTPRREPVRVHAAGANKPPRHKGKLVDPNKRCPCGSGRKYRNCCMNADIARS